MREHICAYPMDEGIHYQLSDGQGWEKQDSLSITPMRRRETRDRLDQQSARDRVRNIRREIPARESPSHSQERRDKRIDSDHPSYRADVLHPIDLIEDVAIMADYNSLPTHGLTSYTVGDVKPIERTIDSVRDILAGLGMQEVLTAVLCNKELLYEKMNCADIRTVRDGEYMSASYSCLRTWLVPVLMDTLSKNVHREYPQNLFETGEVCLRKKDHALDREHCGAADMQRGRRSHPSATST